MIRVTLAYPYEGHAPDETIELDDPTARRLIREGRARAATPAPIDALYTREQVAEMEAARAREALLSAPLGELDARELRARARELGVDLAGARKKSVILALLEEASARASETDAPPSGETEGETS